MRPGSAENCERMSEPPFTCEMDVACFHHAFASALICREGTPQMASAHLGVLGTPSSPPMT